MPLVRLPRLRRVFTCAFLAFAMPAAGAGGWAGYLQLVGNIHTVEPGLLYRSAQLDREQLAAVIRDHGVRTIVNLRGAEPGARWYEDEVRTAVAADVLHVNVGMWANQEPSPETIAQLLDVLRTAPRPILVHCRGGADRSGLVSALFELLVMGRPAEEAGRQLSFRYGHFPWLTSRTGAMDRAFASVAARQP